MSEQNNKLIANQNGRVTKNKKLSKSEKSKKSNQKVKDNQSKGKKDKNKLQIKKLEDKPITHAYFNDKFLQNTVRIKQM